MKPIVCPKCFTKTEQSALAYGCANTDCAREGIPTTLDPTAKIGCSQCGQDMKLRFCPECGFQIAVGEEAAESIPISIVGSEGSGKSNYLSVLIQEMRQSIGRAYNCSLYPLGGDDTIMQYETHYYKPLYEDGYCIPSTLQDEVSPLMYSLVFSKETSGTLCNVTFYDACGANFRNERVMADYNRSVYNSRGILFFIDPFQLPGLRGELEENEGGRASTEDYSALLGRTIQLVRQGLAIPSLKRKIPIPIAVCLTKLDLLYNELDPASFLNFPSRHLRQDSFDLTDFDCCNLEVQALIESWEGGDLIHQVKSQFDHYAFFGLSSLGMPPNAENRVQHIAPYRVGDPFLWLLSQNKIIRAEHHR